MVTYEDLEQTLRQDLRILARVHCVAVLAFAAANWRSDALMIALVFMLIAWPISLLAPMRWREQISLQAYMRYGVRFLPGFLGIFVGAFGASRGPSFPGAALVVGFGVVHLAVIWAFVGPSAADLRRLSPWLGACILGIAGALADLPKALGWTMASFFVYGFVGTATLVRVASVAVDESVVCGTSEHNT